MSHVLSPCSIRKLIAPYIIICLRQHLFTRRKAAVGRCAHVVAQEKGRVGFLALGGPFAQNFVYAQSI